MKPRNFPQDELFQVEQRIARRADELSQRFGADPNDALGHWRRAEREIWDGIEAQLAESTVSVGEADTDAAAVVREPDWVSARIRALVAKR